MGTADLEMVSVLDELHYYFSMSLLLRMQLRLQMLPTSFEFSL